MPSVLFPPGGFFSIDGVNSDAWAAYCRSWSHSLIPTTRNNLVDIPGRVGKRDAGSELSSRMVTLSIGMFNGGSRAGLFQLGRALAAALRPDTGPHMLQFLDDFPGWQIGVIPSADAAFAPNLVHATVDIPCEAGDPHFYSTTPQHVTWTPTGNGQTTNLTNRGNTSTPVKITITPRVGAPPGALQNIVVQIAGAQVNYAGPIAAGDVVVIDTDAMTVTKNGVSDINGWSGDFPQLPGNASLAQVSQAIYADQNGIGASVTFDFTDRQV